MGGLLSTKNVEKLIPRANRYLADSANKALPHLRDCNLGTLKNIQLCDLAEFKIETKISCDFLITIHNIKGIHNARITHLSRRSDTDMELYVEVTLGVLNGALSMIPTDENCGLTGRLTSKMIDCKESYFVIGSVEKPVKIFLAARILPKSGVKVLSVDLGMIDVGCLHFLPSSVKNKISKSLAEKVESFLNDLVGEASRNFLHHSF